MGFSTISIAAPTRNIAPIVTAPAPMSSRRSGTSTPKVPENSAGSMNSPDGQPQLRPPQRARPARSTRTARRGGPAGVAMRRDEQERRRHRNAREDRLGAELGCGAAQDGAEQDPEHRRAHRAADQLAAPLLGAEPISQASPPAHEQAPPSPWTNRARSSATMLSASAEREARAGEQGEAR